MCMGTSADSHKKWTVPGTVQQAHEDASDHVVRRCIQQNDSTLHYVLRAEGWGRRYTSTPTCTRYSTSVSY